MPKKFLKHNIVFVPINFFHSVFNAITADVFLQQVLLNFITAPFFLPEMPAGKGRRALCKVLAERIGLALEVGPDRQELFTAVLACFEA